MRLRSFPGRRAQSDRVNLFASPKLSCKLFRRLLGERFLNLVCPSYQDPFEEYKTRLAKKLAKRAAAQAVSKAPVKEAGDDINWFGVKVGSDAAPTAPDSAGGGGVGKYLNLKRPQTVIGGGGDESKKKRKIGFGDFEGW